MPARDPKTFGKALRMRLHSNQSVEARRCSGGRIANSRGERSGANSGPWAKSRICHRGCEQ
eukprot:scaffold238944_cov33-Tisochrysis_lutea.AAC.5